MVSGRPGPVARRDAVGHVPGDGRRHAARAAAASARNPVPDADKIAALAKLVDGAKAPMIWVGGGALRRRPRDPGAGREDRRTRRVLPHRPGRGRCPPSAGADHGRRLPAVAADRPADRHRHAARRADCSRWAPTPAGLKIARIDIDPAEIAGLTVNVAIVADAADGARALTAAVGAQPTTARGASDRARQERSPAAIQKAQPQMAFLEAIRDVLPRRRHPVSTR